MLCDLVAKCSGSWGMGAEGFRRAPMMHEKLTTLDTTRYTFNQNGRVKNQVIVNHKKTEELPVIASNSK
jgi:hypothetical protein